MTEHIRRLRSHITEKKHHAMRMDPGFRPADAYAAEGLSPARRMSKRLIAMLEAETPVLVPGERIALIRTVRALPDIFTPGEWSEIHKERIHEAGFVCNICPGYARLIHDGLEKDRLFALSRLEDGSLPASQRAFHATTVENIAAVYAFTDRYRDEAARQGNATVAALFDRLPRFGAESFHEALQMFRILHYLLWLEGEYHNTVGRFDQYMYPYFKRDIERGALTEDEAFELLEEFFLTFNRDSDLYTGVQQGDNGQSLMLGGVDRDGNPCFNRLSELCLLASKELRLIDPKINLRVDANTPARVFELGTELTKEGLGFPQYSNDDVVIPGLVALGYDLADARDYTVAACWEFIIPRVGMDVPNIDALSFPLIVDRCLHRDLPGCGHFEDFFGCVRDEIARECQRMADETRNLRMLPAPFMSLFMDGCAETGRDISLGCKYNNYGFHGTGIATAADSLAAIKRLVFDEKSISAAELADAVDADFDGYDALLHRLRYEMPKMGNDDDYVDALACGLLSCFADSLKNRRNDRGGRFRPGTGSAMYYLWHAGGIGASPDGRRKGEAFGANFAPSLFARIDGPLSVILSFTKPELQKVINGGPLTMEFHSTLFRDADSIRKVASLVRTFVRSGGHQLQLNAVNRDALLDAQRRPEEHAGLIVRIWGWSAYFTELDKAYQDHVIRRQTY